MLRTDDICQQESEHRKHQSDGYVACQIRAAGEHHDQAQKIHI